MSLSLILKDGKLLLKDGVPVVGDPGLDGFGNCCCEVGGACCYCENFRKIGQNLAEYGGPADDWNFYYPHLQPLADANNEFLQEWEDAALGLGYECLRSEESYVTFIFDSEGDNGFWWTLDGSRDVRCCGIVDYEAEPTIIVFPEFPEWLLPSQASIYPCIQDEITRFCENDLNKTECDELCGVHHPSETCDDSPCNNQCDCECFEVSIDGKWGIQDSEFLDEEHPEKWESKFVYNCGSMEEAIYHRYNYPFGNAFTYARIDGNNLGGGITIDTIAACGEVNGTRAARWTFGQDGCPNGVEYLDDECYSTWYPELPSCDATTLEEARQINCAWYTGNRPEITVRPCSSSSSSSGGGE